MTTQIVMPQLGESVAEGIIGKWLKAEGDAIAKDEPIVEVVTDKVNAEIPSPVAGTLLRISAAEGATVLVGEEIAVIGAAGETISAPEAAVSAPPTESSEKTPPALEASVSASLRPAPQPGSSAATAVLTAVEIGSSNGSRRVVRSSPLVQRLASEHGIDLAMVPGTGIGGRVSKKDVVQFIQTGPAISAAPAAVPASGQTPAAPPKPMAGDEVIPISPVRRMIAEHMVKSKFTIPHATTIIEIDMTPVVRYRDGHKAEWQRQEGGSLSFMAFVAQATVEALRAYPLVNSEWGGDRIILKKNINLGLAVAAGDGLIVPNIKNADRLNLAGLAHAITDLAERARNRKLTPDDVSGGTFTLNNTGAIGSVWSMSIINYPQAGILSADSIVKRVRVMDDDSIAIRHVMNLSMSFDHRPLDGATVSAFMQAIRKRLEGWPADAPLH